jgi:hypothetical protein
VSPAALLAEKSAEVAPAEPEAEAQPEPESPELESEPAPEAAALVVLTDGQTKTCVKITRHLTQNKGGLEHSLVAIGAMAWKTRDVDQMIGMFNGHQDGLAGLHGGERRSLPARHHRNAGGADGQARGAEEGQPNANAEVEASWLRDVPNHPLQQAVIDLDKAFRNFFEGRARYPQSRRRGNPDSSVIPIPSSSSRRRIASSCPGPAGSIGSSIARWKAG